VPVQWDNAAPTTPTRGVQWDEPAAAPAQPSAFQKNIAEPVTTGLRKAAEGLSWADRGFGLFSPPAGGSQQGVQDFARNFVPQTPIGAGAAAGSVLLPPLAASRVAPPAIAAIAKSSPALTRILGGFAGGEAGGELSGEPAGKGGVVGAATTAGGEATSGILSKLARSAPGAKGLIGDADAARIAGAIGNISPTLKASMGAGISSAQQLKDWVLSAAGNKALSAEMQRATQAIDAQIGKGGLQIPSMQTGPDPLAAIRAQLGLQPGAPLPPGFEIQGGIPQQPGVSLNDAWKQLGILGQRGYGGAKEAVATRTTAGLPAREETNALRAEIETALQQADPTGKALQQWQQAVGTFREGSQPLKLLKDTASGRVYPTYGEDVRLNTPMLQQRLSQNREVLERKLGPEKFAELADAVNRGAPVGAKDILQPGPGGALDALRMIFSGKGGSAATIRAGTGVGELLPNVSSRYIGQQPMTLPPELQTILNTALQQKGARAVQ
jgi:hypothetical protein